MFKIAKLEQVSNEKVSINFILQEKNNFIEPQINIKIRRYLKNQFSIFLTFNTEYNYDNIDYSGIVEFTFNLDNYLKK